jgi:hypothetical protein
MAIVADMFDSLSNQAHVSKSFKMQRAKPKGENRRIYSTNGRSHEHTQRLVKVAQCKCVSNGKCGEIHRVILFNAYTQQFMVINAHECFVSPINH